LVEAGKDPARIFEVLHRHFTFCSDKGKAMLLTAYAKLATRFPSDLIDQAQIIFRITGEHADPDLQQRSIEYNQLMEESD